MWGTHREMIIGEEQSDPSDFYDEIGRELYIDRILSLFMPTVTLLKLMFHKDSQQLLNKFVKYGGRYYFIGGKKGEDVVYEIKSGKTITRFMDLFRVADSDDVHAQIIRASLKKGENEIVPDSQESIFAALYEFIKTQIQWLSGMKGLFVSESLNKKSSKKKSTRSKSSKIVSALEQEEGGFETERGAIAYVEAMLDRQLRMLEKREVKSWFKNHNPRLNLDDFPALDPQKRGSGNYDEMFD